MTTADRVGMTALWALLLVVIAALGIHDWPGATDPTVTPTPTPTVIVNGPGWVPVWPELADVLAEGDDTAPANADTREWETCLTTEGDPMVIVCPDGYVESL